MVAIVDIIIVGIIVLFTYIGARRGLLNEVISLLFLIAAVLLPLFLADNMMDLFYRPATDEIDAFYRKAIYGLVFAAMFIGILLLGMLTRVLAQRVMSNQFTILNHVLGGVFGFLRGVVACIALIALINLSVSQLSFWDSGSRLTPWLKPVADLLNEQFPSDYLEAASDFGSKLDELVE